MTTDNRPNTILVVDDNEEARTLLEDFLTAQSYRVLLADSGEAALRMFDQEAGNIDLVLLDVMLPDLSGVEVCRRLKAHQVGRLTPVIMVTARVDTTSKVAGLEGGAEDYVTKPIDFQELRARVHAMLRVRHQNLDLLDPKAGGKLQQLVAQASKLSTIGAMVGEVIHEINNPLNGILNYADLLADGEVAEVEDIREVLGIIRSEAQRIHGLVGSLTTFRLPGSGMVVTDITQVVDTVLNISRILLKKAGVELVRRYEPGRYFIEGDTSRLSQVFLNLISNAIRALDEKFGTGPGKRLFIDVTGGGEPPGVQVAVRDNGIGMTPEVIDRAFESAFSTKRSSGLGLSIAQTVMVEHRGTIEVSSIPGEYTEFRLWFPAVPAPDKAVRPPSGQS